LYQCGRQDAQQFGTEERQAQARYDDAPPAAMGNWICNGKETQKKKREGE
jgi:hypothetical protein